MDKHQDLFLAMVAGETSGDLLAGLVLQGLANDFPGLRSAGIGGPRMAQAGFDAWWPSERLAVHGYSAELVRRIWGILRIRKQLVQRLTAQPPKLFVGVDAPDFNLGVEERLRAQGIKTVHFVCPSIWAWRPERVEKIRRSADHVLCIFPFEPSLLAQHGIAATYVGHPLANVIPLQPNRAAARQQLGLPLDGEVLAVLPGSRASEVSYIAKPFFLAAARLLQARPSLTIIVPAVPALRARIDALAAECGILDRIRVLDGQSHLALEACDCTLIASGTATLEAALYKRPMVISYHMHAISWRLMLRKQLQPWVGLPNILCQDFVVPELLQAAATPEALAEAVTQWLDAPRLDPARLAQLEQRFHDLHLELRRDTPKLAADAIQKILSV
ncbi:lipid-A-disaccharide synthase [Comamonas piscis]|uniref:Lipid-A-disaccharide synthase n=1 Tax=Comamonas piscis TaxID=1562974 RepID=A0A7G5EJW0_9BURK|nr:lipid-A-disaccharide synthase [Comamonas piscis]QMV74285.1 lipid-A-disaccharide synthase [Comamonas piscis]WSO32731.1 lipid-A-disaccharide synthase [Comamonas piscis]